MGEFCKVGLNHSQAPLSEVCTRREHTQDAMVRFTTEPSKTISSMALVSTDGQTAARTKACGKMARCTVVASSQISHLAQIRPKKGSLSWGNLVPVMSNSRRPRKNFLRSTL